MKRFNLINAVFAVSISIAASNALAGSSGAPAYGAILAGAKRARNHQSQGSCDYSNAANSGGWGWNSATNSSCPPVNNNGGYCDFSNADHNDGWGWNAATGQSCR